MARSYATKAPSTLKNHRAGLFESLHCNARHTTEKAGSHPPSGSVVTSTREENPREQKDAFPDRLAENGLDGMVFLDTGETKI
tara:strand:+ start:372 stop:620 length:249 start_codon:yes stop_codon:yes gene_type:complete